MTFIATAYAATEAVAEQATSSAGLVGVAGTLGLNGKLFLAQLINFVILAVALWYLLFKPLTRYMEERSEKIASGLRNAEKFEEQLRLIAAERARVLELAEDERRAVVSQARDESKRIMEKTHEDAAVLMTETRRRLEREATQSKEKALAEVRAQAADLVVLAAEKVLRDRVTVAVDKQLVERALNEIS